MAADDNEPVDNCKEERQIELVLHKLSKASKDKIQNEIKEYRNIKIINLPTKLTNSSPDENKKDIFIMCADQKST